MKADGRTWQRPHTVVIMGVAGSGKTSIGTLLARKLGWQFADADSFHPQSNIEKMAAGIALDDRDRVPWLDAIRNQLMRWGQESKNVVLACSALKQSYREQLQFDAGVAFVYLKGDFHLFEKRLADRQQHYMKSNMLASQFQVLEEPDHGLTVDAAQPPNQIVDQIVEALKLHE
jgi:gluconokinase